ncbi:MAG: ABC transporter substrate-binding protein [Treponema sp.]|nr:ABC transporter substrate-binding protein [Treponema sp.]
MKKIGILLLVLMTLPVMLFAGGGQSAASANALRFGWWGNVARDDRTNAVVRLFQQVNPGITVEVEAGVAFAAYWDRLATQSAAGNLPDVIQQDVSYIKGFNKNGLLSDLNSYARKGGVIDLTHWSDGAVAAGRIGNSLAGLILATNAWGMIVDPAVLTRAGVTIDDTKWTWTDYEAYARQIYQRTQVQSIPPFNIRQVIEHISRQFGSPCYEANDKEMGITNNQAAYNAVRDYMNTEMRLMQAGVLYDVNDAFVTGKAMAEEPLPLGRTWNQMNWSNQLVGFQDAARRNLDYIMFPQFANKTANGTYYRASMFISITSRSQVKDLAAKFINFFVNDLSAGRILLAERGIPVNTQIRQDIYGVVSAGDQKVMDYITRIEPYTSPADPAYPDGAGTIENTILRNIMQNILLGRLTVDNGLAQMVRDANAELARLNQ